MNALTARLFATVSLLVAAGVVFATPQTPSSTADHQPVGVLTGAGLERLGVTVADRRAAKPNRSVRYAGMTRFLDRARTVVTGSLDDSTLAMTKAIDAMDTYGIKAKIYDNALTLNFAIPAAAAVTIRAGGKPVPLKLAKLTDRWNVEYFRREENATLVTIRPNQILEIRVVE